MIATIYSTATGGVLRTWSSDVPDHEPDLDLGEAFIEGSWLGFRIDLVTLEPVPLLDFSVSVSNNLVSNIPPNTFAFIDIDQQLEVTDGSLEFEVEFPETIRVELVNPIYNPIVVEVPCESNP